MFFFHSYTSTCPTLLALSMNMLSFLRLKMGFFFFFCDMFVSCYLLLGIYIINLCRYQLRVHFVSQTQYIMPCSH